ncbi:LamG-like jellyroll fold domain-containing protein [Pedosphaera parvula]|uniref:Uncharacterized protein n=1 Tax=Pedosphaera parvula (strain Ellin514) TaxID=320771 RepID=B9XDF8_PEDPL|nr:LamG-like jellyroll fold domain-containing protein [Pedosphaera parvula]EEF62104.1 hypothetical protein Cflav_PD6379 [Pedosphaera parvula Ellin514]
MSNFIYPLGIIDKQKVTLLNTVVSDQFEDGTTMTRLLWSPQNFKRKFDITHGPLTLAEYRYLRSFYSQRSGMFDSFWYRDNVNRKGNASVRFASTLADDHDGVLFNTQITLNEVAAIRTLPEWDEVSMAASSAPILWYDANREFYLSHAGNLITEPAVYDSANQHYPGTWTAGSSLILDGSASQYQSYSFTGGNWSDSPRVVELAAGKPGCTIFAFCRHSSPVAVYRELLFSLGVEGTNKGIGLQLGAENYYAPWIGTDEPFYTCRFVNDPPDTWRSIAVTFPTGADGASMYVNAVAIPNTDGVGRAYQPGPAVFGTSPSHNYPANPAAAVTNANMAHVMVFNTALTVDQIKALHNLLGYQYGLSIIS